MPDPNVAIPINPQRPRISQKELREQAARALDVLSHYGDAHPAILAQAEETSAVAADFISVYDEARTKQAHATREQQDLEAAVAPLRKAMQAWMGAIVAEAPAIDVASFSNSVRTPRGTIEDAQRLLELVAKYESAQPLAFAAEMNERLSALIDTAKSELADVDGIARSNAELMQKARSLAITLHRRLVALRRSLRVILGSTHPDYRKLLTRKRRGSASADEVEDVTVEDDGAEGIALANPPEAPEEATG